MVCPTASLSQDARTDLCRIAASSRGTDTTFACCFSSAVMSACVTPDGTQRSPDQVLFGEPANTVAMPIPG